MKNKKILLIILLFLNFIAMPKNMIFATHKVNISANSAILIDSKTGSILYEKNSQKKSFPASTTKILTAIVILENCKLEEIVTVKQSAISAVPDGYSTAFLTQGEQMSVKDLLTLFLVHSSNDSGYVLAEYCSNSIQNFAKLMNDTAKKIGCKNSNFLNPCGIHDDNHYTTSYDLSLIARYAMQNETFRSIVSMKECNVPSTNKYGVRTYKNTNELLNPYSKYYLNDCIGIKTGFTSQAKSCLVSCFNKDGLEIICVDLGSNYPENTKNSRFIDSKILHDYVYSNFATKIIKNKNDVIDTLQIKKASKKTKNLNIILEDNIYALVNINEDLPSPTISIDKNLIAPIKQGSIVGNISYEIYGIKYTQNLIAKNDVERDLTWVFLIIVILIIFGCLILFLFLFKIFFNKNKI